ncbi:uncharacterized protein LOC142560003 [Dermacentor variabilis]|uniref:uncharacterized protein LOC142560003 n=1 Tax=Dermacentor variabilis TaxID=34621 RepID=UPI003F5CBBB2
MEHASVSACVDFYEHTCAYWRERNPVPDYAWRHSYLDHMRMNIEADVRDALKAESQRRARSITTGLVTTMIDIYKGCTSKQDSEKGRKAMYDLDVAMFRGNRPLAQVLSELVLQFDIDGFFRVRFLRSEFSYPKEYLERILNLKPTDVDNPVAYRRVSDFMGSKVMDWHLYFSEVTHRSVLRLPFVVVKLVNRHYLLDINQFFDSLSDPSGDTTHFMDYLRLLLFLNFATALPNLSKVTEAYWRFAHDLRQEPDRWRLCLYFLDDILPRSLSWFYHHYHLTLRVAKEGNVEEHLRTVTSLKDVFGMLLANTDAAPFNMRVDGAIKVEKMNVVMFFVPDLVEGDAIQIPPPTLDVDTSNIVSAALEARRIEVMTYYNFSSFVERGKQFGPPYKVLDLNCRYNYGTNTLYIPHALFHGPLYKEGEKK